MLSPFCPALHRAVAASGAAAFALLLCLSSAGWAQESDQKSEGGRAPLKMTFVDATPQQSGAIHDKLRKIIKNSDDIAFKSPEEFLFEAQDFEITLDVLGSEKQREEKTEQLRRAMRAHDLESVVVYKRTGDTLHIIVMGPNATELKHYRSPVKRPRISDKQAVTVLKRLFEVLVPKVEEFRKKEGDSQGDDEPKQKDEDGDDTPAGPTNLEPMKGHVSVSGGPIVGRRSLSIDTQNIPRALQHGTPFFGGGARLSSTFGVIPGERAAMGATALVQYGRFRTRFEADEPPAAGTVFRAGGAFRFLGALSSNFALFGELGGQGMDVGLESNPIYVGSTYFGVTAGAGLYYRFGDFGRLRFASDLVFTFLTSTNERAFGNSAFSLGFSGDARFTIFALQPVLLAAYYDLDVYFPKHPEPREYAGPATGTDFLHIWGVSVEYQF